MFINKLPVPALLIHLIDSGNWKHPGDDTLRKLIPELYHPVNDPVDFLSSYDAIRRNSKVPMGGDFMMETYKEGIGSKSRVPGLPWVDAEKRLFVAVCAIPGADVGIALDYRTSCTDPRVVALVYNDEDGFYWTEVSSTFTQFVELCQIHTG